MAANVEATAVRTVDWLASVDSIAIPVYQRQYRWEISSCAQLLDDIRAAADGDERASHFLGSILSASDGRDAGDRDLILIDGQQRVTTLTLLVAALRQTVERDDPGRAAELARAIVHPSDPSRTRLRPHPAWAGVYERVVLTGDTEDAGRFGENLTYFRSQIRPDEVERVWRGLERLEHVAITLGPAANAQQIFESLNSTGAPLRDHELIHNYLLMGLGHEDQQRVEREHWVPIERATGAAIGDFFRDYLVARMGHEGLRTGRAVYDDFCREFPRLGPDAVDAVLAELREFADVYGRILDPRRVDDAEVAEALRAVNEIDRAAYPLVLLAVHDWLHREAPRDRLLATLRRVQSLWLRRELVGVRTRRLVGRLVRSWRSAATVAGDAHEADVFGRITPSDLRCRLAVRYRELPHADYVLRRLGLVGGAGDPAALGAAFVAAWPRDSGVPIDDDDLTPILDAERRPGWYAGWRQEFEYCEFRGEHWEVSDIQHLFRRVFQRLWTDRPDELLAFSARHRGPVYDAPAWPGDWAELPAIGGDARWLFQGLAPRFLLAWTQELLEELGLADEVLVKYAWGMA
ncbi:MAG: DUF262 domain-containing protein [Microbacteriaceae bacterium]|nr:DUF262 domain-containing protein [Microbacteriaceae bacterium]